MTESENSSNPCRYFKYYIIINQLRIKYTINGILVKQLVDKIWLNIITDKLITFTA